MEKRQIDSAIEHHKVELKKQFTQIKEETSIDSAISALGGARYYPRNVERATVLSQYVASLQVRHLMDHLNASPQPPEYLATLEVLADTIQGDLGSTETRNIHPPRRPLARTIINAYTELAISPDTSAQKIAQETAHRLAKIKTAGEAGEYVFRLVAENIKTFGFENTNSRVQSQEIPLNNLNDQGRASVLLLTEKLEDIGAVEKTFLYRLLVGNTITQSELSFIGLLHQRLVVENNSAYAPKRTNSGEKFFDDSVLSLVGLLNSLAQKHDQNSHAARIAQAIRTNVPRGIVPFKLLIEIANQLTPPINAQIRSVDPNFELSNLSVQNIESTGEACKRILYVAFNDIQPSEKELMIKDIISTTLDLWLTYKQEQKVITIGDIIVRNPGATPQDIENIREQIQTGKTLNQASEPFRQQRQQSNSSYWERFKQRFGIFS